MSHAYPARRQGDGGPWSAAEAAAFMDDLRGALRGLGVFRGDKAGYIARAVFVLAIMGLAWWGLITFGGWATRAVLVLLAGYAGVQASARP